MSLLKAKLLAANTTILLTLALAGLLFAPSALAFECIYAPKAIKESPQSEMGPQGECGELVGEDTLNLGKGHLERLAFSEENLAEVVVTSKVSSQKVFWVAKSGRAIRTHFYDNGADYFTEGLARTISNRKFGYFNKRLEVVIKAEYDFAFPFHNGHAVVCNGCKLESEHEHARLIGGKWGVIDRQGQSAIPVTFTRSELLSKDEFKALFDKLNWLDS